MFKKIREGEYEFHDEYWKNISSNAIDMITKMLVVDQTFRWTADQLLDHPWMLVPGEELTRRDISNVIKEMKTFNSRRKFRAAATAIMMSNRIRNLIKNLHTKRDEENTKIEEEKNDVASTEQNDIVSSGCINELATLIDSAPIVAGVTRKSIALTESEDLTDENNGNS